MTRETKIGLLVGLAFIIVIGILLSDHLTSSTDPPPATLAGAGSNVMQAVNTPGSTTAAQAQQMTAPQVQPSAQVPTSADLTARPQQQPVQIVQVGPGGSQSEQPITIQSQQQDQPLNTAAPTVAESTNSDAPVITHVPAQPVDGSLVGAVRRSGEELVALDESGRPTGNSTPPSWTQALTGMTEYQAQPGDSVSKMAMQFMGGNTRTNRDLIIKANPALQKDPNRVIVGQTYLIPTPGAASRVSGSELASIAPPPTAPPNTSVASATEYWYTVEDGDSLWKIASEQLGKPSAIAAIKELNKDTLRGGDTVYVGMKLKLPGRPLAQAR